jgi:(p)ppGpp synthase/HD superfamily hydrolase
MNKLEVECVIKPTGLCSLNINKALELSAKAHLAQIRKGTDIPYITHPYAVGMILLKAGCSEEIVIAGILHDTVEDTCVTLDDIKKELGEEVARIVAGCSEPDKDLSWEDRKQHTIDELKSAPLEIQFVACADKLHNISTMIDEHERIGDELWKRFKRGKDQQGWYYRGLLASLSNGPIGYEPIYREFKLAVESLFGEHENNNS